MVEAWNFMKDSEIPKLFQVSPLKFLVLKNSDSFFAQGLFLIEDNLKHAW